MASTAASPRGASADEVLEWSRGFVDPALRAAVDTLPGDMRHIAGYHLGWWDQSGERAETDGGKALRPALVLLCARAVGGTATSAVPAAVAVELVHNFSLLHDDVMDRDATRRHRPAAWRVFGASAAILAGDALVSLASDVLADSGHCAALPGIRVLTAAVQELIRGQIMDLAFEQRGDVDLLECERMAQAKTGALLGAACELGATFGRGTPEQVAHLRGFGEKTGLAFQHVDDLLGIWGDPESTGKSAYSDLQGRKKTLPIAAALHSGTPAGGELAGRYQRENPFPDAELAEMAGLVEAAGGRAWSHAQADELMARAQEHVHTAPALACVAELVALSDLATRRDR